MRIVIERSTLTEKKWHPIFDVVLLLVEDRRHSIAAEAISLLMESDWLRTRPPADRELIRLNSLRQSQDRLADRSSVTIDAACRRGGMIDFQNADTRVHPLDAVLFLSFPFQVVLENEWFDGAFLLWMARALGFTHFLDAHRERRFQFRHAGGKDGIARSAEILSRGVWPRRDDAHAHARRLWTCAIIDNDARFPGDDPNAAIRSNTEPHVAFLRQLKRRSIESYLPEGALRKRDSSAAFRRRVEALFRLSEEQRAHYDMKSGFRLRDNVAPEKAAYLGADLPNEEKSLFQNINDEDWRLLRQGFGRNLAEVYTETNYRPSWRDPMLVNKDDRTEIMSILEEIYQRI